MYRAKLATKELPSLKRSGKEKDLGPVCILFNVIGAMRRLPMKIHTPTGRLAIRPDEYRPPPRASRVAVAKLAHARRQLRQLTHSS